MTEERPKSKKIGNYILGKTIGEGTFGKVKLATHTLTEEKVAIKILVKEKIIDVADVERVSRQIHILKLIRHPNIIQLYEIIQTSRHLFLVMEFVEHGELFDYIVQKNRIEESEACRYFKDVLSGIAYLHKLFIVHRDLKPENLLIDWKNSLKIVDFGLSNTYKPGELLKTACGSPCYAAPQMIASKKYNGLEVDLWSCGVILFAMVCGYLPFEDNNTSLLYKKILSGQYTLPQFVSADFKSLLERILSVNPAQRFKIEEIYNHPWCSKFPGTPLASGIVVGYHRIPVDREILSKLAAYGFDLEYAERCIEANKHNHISTTYYLLLKKTLKAGGYSAADLSNPNFDYSSIEPFKRPQNERKFHFFSSSEDGPAITLQQREKRQNSRSTRHQFPLRLHTSKNYDSTKSEDHKTSNQFFQRFHSSVIDTKKSPDLRMYLKMSKRREATSETKRRPQRKKNWNYSVYQQASQDTEQVKEQQPLMVRLGTQASEEKYGRIKTKYQLYKQPQNFKFVSRGGKLNKSRQ